MLNIGKDHTCTYALRATFRAVQTWIILRKEKKIISTIHARNQSINLHFNIIYEIEQIAITTQS